MSRRRQFGTLRRLASGKWQARYRLGDGRLVSAPQRFVSKAEASRWLAMVEIDQARRLWLDPDAGRVTLSDYATSWLQSKVRIAPRTREMYALQLRLHILPRIADDVRPLGTAELAQISPKWVRAWYAAVAMKRSPSVVLAA